MELIAWLEITAPSYAASIFGVAEKELSCIQITRAKIELFRLNREAIMRQLRSTISSITGDSHG